MGRNWAVGVKKIIIKMSNLTIRDLILGGKKTNPR